MNFIFGFVKKQYDKFISNLNRPEKIIDGLFKGDLPKYDSATSLELAAFKCCDKKMFRYARNRRREALIEGGFKPWF